MQIELKLSEILAMTKNKIQLAVKQWRKGQCGLVFEKY